MCGCKKCMAISGGLFLVVGLLLLLRDLSMLNLFGRVEGITLLFLLMGIGSLAKRNCKDCMAMCGTDKKK